MIPKLYRALYRIRRVEEEIARVYPTDVIRSPVHLSIGQEAVAVGVCAALEPGDAVFGGHRSHAMYLAKGGDLNAMIAELHGKATGCAGGRGGSMHLLDLAAGVLPTSAIVGTTIPHAVGWAYAQRLRGTGRVAVAFFGDGAADEGVFHEALSFAAVKRVPVLFVCENNGYAEQSRQGDRQPGNSIFERVQSYGIGGGREKTGDVLFLHRTAKSLVAMLRAGFGPLFIELVTYRWRGHVGPGEDFDLGYRSREEARWWMENDQVAKLAEQIRSAERGVIQQEVELEIAEAFRLADAAPFPEPGTLLDHAEKVGEGAWTAS
jgi:TPP-dependent pyruvate/acetoin dehydrogenase alpha subunit